MKLVNITNNNQELVNNQLSNTDAYFVQVFSAGSITVIYTEAKTHLELLAVNKQRHIRPHEAEEILQHFLKDIPENNYKKEKITIVHLDSAVEYSIPLIESLKK